MTDNIQKLLRKQAAIQQQIDAAKKAARRKSQIGELAGRAGALNLTDEEILTALRSAKAAAELLPIAAAGDDE